MNVLALDTATEACSAALLYQGQMIERYELAPRQHTALILPMIEELFAEAGIRTAQLDALAFGCGPGSFTGLRIAASVVQGIAFAADLPVAPVSTLAALAYRAHQQHDAEHIATAIDARMDEIYWGLYQATDTELTLLGEECVCTPALVPLPSGDQRWYGSGSGWTSYSAVLKQRLAVSSYGTEDYPHASAIAILGARQHQHGDSVSAEQAQPVYLRHQVAAKA